MHATPREKEREKHAANVFDTLQKQIKNSAKEIKLMRQQYTHSI